MNKYFSNLDNTLIGNSVRYYAAASSTNDLAAAAIAAKEHEGIVFVSDTQTKGRGQRGNSWESEAGRNLTFSVLVYPLFLEVMDHFYLSKIVAVAMVEALSSFGIEAAIKWPNDIYVGDKKIAGILIENGLTGTAYSHSIWGIGLNVNQVRFASDAPNPVSMKQVERIEFDRDEVLHTVLRSLDKWYLKLKLDELNAIDDAYSASLYRKSGLYLYRDGNGLFNASIHSIAHTGELVLEDEEGKLRSYAFKEVAFVI